jgi:hypothetical protein
MHSLLFARCEQFLKTAPLFPNLIGGAIAISSESYVNSHGLLTITEQKFEPFVCNSVAITSKLPMRQTGRGHYFPGKRNRGV